MPNPTADDVIGQYSSSGWTLPTLTGHGSIDGVPFQPTLTGIAQANGQYPTNFYQQGLGVSGAAANPYPQDALQQMLDRNAGATSPFGPLKSGYIPVPTPGFDQYGRGGNGNPFANNYTVGSQPTPTSMAQATANGTLAPSNILDRGADNPFRRNPSGLGVGGGVGSPFQNTLGGNAGGSVGGGASKPMTRGEQMQQQLDQRFGQGWSAQFTAQNGMDPISFYEREVPAHITDPAERASIAMQRASNDAQYHPAELADWAQKHGNTPIPDSQWRIWSRINQGGGPDYNAGRGVDPYGVH